MLVAVAAYAADGPQVTISADKKTVGVDDTLSVEVSVSGSGLGSVSQPQIEGMENFDIVGTSSGEQVSIVNMNITTSRTYTYTVRPRKAGTKAKLRARVEVKGEKYLSNTIEVETVQSTGGGRAAQPPPGFFSIPFAPHMPGGGRQYREDDFILHSRLSTTKVYVGQEVVYTMAFYRGADVFSDMKFLPPEIKGFWVETPPDKERHKTGIAKLAGREYELTEMYMLLYPLSPGTVTIPAGAVLFQPNPMAAATRKNSNTLALAVLPLPGNGKPKDFSGLVGRFSIKAEALEKTAVAGKPLTLVVTVSGSGNLQSIPRPHEPQMTGVEKYEPEARDNFTRTGNGSEGSRAYTYLLVPQKEGKLSIGGFGLNYFDPKAGKYETIATKPMELDVATAPASAPAATPTPLAERAQTAKPQTEPFYQKPGFSAIVLTLFIVAAGTAIHMQRRNQMLRNQRYARQIRARSMAEEKLKSAKSAMAQGDTAAFYETLEHSIRQYISDRSNIPPSSVTPEEISQKLGKDAPKMQNGIAVLRKCIAARYSPAPQEAGVREQGMKAALEEAILAIEEAEKQ